MLKRWGASAFHSTDFYSGGGEFKRKDDKKRQAMFEEDSRAIPKMLGGKVEKVTLIAFRPKEYRESVPKGWLDLFGSSIHSMRIQVVLLELGWWREEKCPSLDFLYFMETGDEDEEKVHETVRGMRADPKTSKVIAVKAFTPANKGDARGLEAADFWCWHWNKYQADRALQGRPDEPRADFRAAVRASKNRVDEYFLTGKKLKYFCSRVPENVLRNSSY